MHEPFLQRYSEELAALRQQAAKFADAFPKIAGRLRLTGDIADDPQTERLLQSFAYSAARIRLKLDDEFPELTNELLEALYPHFLATIPSMTIVKFQPDNQLHGFQKIPRLTEIISDIVDGDTCQFRTTQDVEIAPVEVAAVNLCGQPVQAPASPYSGVAACLYISLRLLNNQTSFKEIGLKHLRFYLAAPWRQAVTLYELLGNHTLGIALAGHTTDVAPLFLDAGKLELTGLQPDESMLPYPQRSFSGYRLLSEFFALPQKFLFFDVNGLQGQFQDTLELFIYLNETNQKLESSVSYRDLELHTTPAINLFHQACEPVRIDGTRTEYLLVPDARKHRTREIYSVERVLLSDKNSQAQSCQPLFGRTHIDDSTGIFWKISRHFNADDGTGDIDIAFTERNYQAFNAKDMVASIDTLCTNRNLPEKLPFGGGHPHLNMPAHNSVAAVQALLPPTPAIRRAGHSKREWHLISHLLLNHASLADGNGSALKDILKLYVMRDTPETRQIIDAITRVNTHNSTARLKAGAVVSGTDITIEFDSERIDKGSAYLFGCVIERFLGLYTSINSFTRLTVMFHGNSLPVAIFAPRSAERPLI